MGMGFRGVQGEQGVLPGDLCEFQGENPMGMGFRGALGDLPPGGKSHRKGVLGFFWDKIPSPLRVFGAEGVEEEGQDILHLPNPSRGSQKLRLLPWGWSRDLTLPLVLSPKFQNRNKSGYLENLFQETDLNNDKELSFKEFTVVLSKLADDVHRISHGSQRCGPDRD